jgi:hypothetical protein
MCICLSNLRFVSDGVFLCLDEVYGKNIQYLRPVKIN